MKLIIAMMFVLSTVVGLACAEYVSGYFRQDGTYVQGYYKSDANNTVQDNYSYKGNKNPYTNESGSNYNRSNPSSSYYGTQKKTKQFSN